MGHMKILNPRHIQIKCECGEYVHEIQRAEDGELQYEEFKVDKPKAPVTEQADPKAKKKGKRYIGMFETEGED